MTFDRDFFQKRGLKEGDVIAIYMENCPEFVAAWLGLSKIGIVTAWINYNLRLQPLAHTIQTANVKAIICSANLQQGLCFMSPLDTGSILGQNENLKIFCGLTLCRTYCKDAIKYLHSEFLMKTNELLLLCKWLEHIPRSAKFREQNFSVKRSSRWWFSGHWAASLRLWKCSQGFRRYEYFARNSRMRHPRAMDADFARFQKSVN